jgi:hypothetical protein
MKLKANIIKARREIMKIERRISKAEDALEAAQVKCKHPVRVARYGSNTGNYDPHADCYWTDFACMVCGKFWTMEGSIHDPNALYMDRHNDPNTPLWQLTLTEEQLKNKQL